MTRWLLGLALAGAGLLCFSQGARANAFDISPVTVTLSPQTSSAMVTLTNRAPEVLRFHVSAYAWDQKPNGEMILNPTNDVVFFPAMLTLNPKETRNLRIGVQAKPGAVEKTYRVFVQELPPPVTSQKPGSVRVLTKTGIPVFLLPATAAAKPVLTDLAVKESKLTFNLKNTGNKHLRMQKLVVKLLDAGKLLYSKELDPWYVLAGGTRNYALDLPADACKAQKTVQIELESDQGAATASLADARCAP